MLGKPDKASVLELRQRYTPWSEGERETSDLGAGQGQPDQPAAAKEGHAEIRFLKKLCRQDQR